MSFTEDEALKAKLAIMNAVRTLKEKSLFSAFFLKQFDFQPREVPTAEVGLSNGKIVLDFNPIWILTLNNEQLEGLLMHELMHVVARHWERSEGKNPIKWNYAEDLVVNLDLVKRGWKLPDGGVMDESGKYDGWAVEEVYADLKDKEIKVNILVKHPSCRERGVWEQVRRNMIRRALASSDGRGLELLPSGIREEILNVGSQLERFNFEARFNYEVGNALSRELTWNTLHQYSFPLGRKLPGRNKHSKQVVIAVDTSGSIDEREAKQFLMIARKLTFRHPDVEATVVYCDERVLKTVKLKPYQDVSKLPFPRGSGGTSFIPVFELVNRMKPKPSILIYLTDLEGEYPVKKPNYPVVWVAEEHQTDSNYLKSAKKIGEVIVFKGFLKEYWEE